MDEDACGGGAPRIDEADCGGGGDRDGGGNRPPTGAEEAGMRPELDGVGMSPPFVGVGMRPELGVGMSPALVEAVGVTTMLAPDDATGADICVESGPGRALHRVPPALAGARAGGGAVECKGGPGGGPIPRMPDTGGPMGGPRCIGAGSITRPAITIGGCYQSPQAFVVSMCI
jgi:hypothetical protein